MVTVEFYYVDFLHENSRNLKKKSPFSVSMFLFLIKFVFIEQHTVKSARKYMTKVYKVSIANGLS